MFSFAILSMWISLCFGESSIVDDSKYLLPRSVSPIHYTITMSPNLTESTFTGSVVIKIAVEEPINEIILHQRDLNITKKNIKLTLIDNFSKEFPIKDAGKFGTTDQEFYRITFQDTLPENGYILSILDFRGSLEQDFVGFYSDGYRDHNNTIIPYAVTNFQPTFARYAFPCFDEPALKANFKVYIVRPKNYFSISNNPLLSTTKLDNNLEEDEFDESEIMSTYSVSFLISQLIQSRTIGVNAAVARPEYIRHNANHYFLHVADEIVVWYEKLLKTKFTLPKLQHVALPSFYNLDMDAWGFITHHEVVMLGLNNSETNLQEQMTVSLSHKICHQWFGNLLTVKWWSYVWLNEGFCVYFSYAVVDKLNPKWNVTQNLLPHETNRVMRYDYLTPILPLSHVVETPEQISNVFNLISYSKGAAVIRMLEAIVSPHCFRQGISKYMENFGFEAVEPKDLYDTMQESLDRKTEKLLNNLKISEIMSTWDIQTGFPLVTVKRNYDYGDTMRNVTFTQEKFGFGPEESTYLWTIPINYATKSNPSFKETIPTHWLKDKTETMEIQNLTRKDWLIVNKKQAYYYRVNYDKNNWDLIIKALRNNINSIDQLNRIQLIHDSFAIASMGLIDISIPFHIAETLKAETRYGSMRALRTTLDNMEKRVSGTKAENLLQDFIGYIVNEIYSRYNIHEKRTVNHQNKLINELAFSWLSQLNEQKCTTDALNMYNNWRRGLPLPEYLEKHVMCSVVKNSKEKRWEYLFAKYNNTDKPLLKGNIFYALGCTTDKNLLKRLLSFTDKVEYHNIVNVLRSIMARGQTGLGIVLDYMSLNFDTLYVNIGKNNMNELLLDIGSRITVQPQLNQLRELSNKYNNSQSNLFELAIEKSAENIEWNKNYLNRLTEYLENYETATTTCCLPYNTLLLICVTLLLKF